MKDAVSVVLVLVVLALGWLVFKEWSLVWVMVFGR